MTPTAERSPRWLANGLPVFWALVLLLAVPLVAQSEPGTQSAQQLSVHTDKLLVPSLIGFGVQLDPYEYPPTAAQWTQIKNRLDLLKPAFLRVMLHADMYCLQLNSVGCQTYVWSDRSQPFPEAFQQTLRILDWAQSHHIPVMLGEWSWPNLSHVSTVLPITSPADPRWAEIIAPLLQYLLHSRHYTVLRFYNYMNEPNGGWMWPGGNKGVDYGAWLRGLQHLRGVLDQEHLQQIALVGPDNSANWDWLDRTAHDAASTVGAWEMHWYPKDSEVTGGEIFRLLDGKRRMLLATDPDAVSKPRFMGEVGLITGRINGDQQPRVRTFRYGMLMADLAVQICQAGWMGASAWDLDDAMHVVNGKPHTDPPGPLTLKTWGFWNSQGARMGNPNDESIRPWFTPWMLLAHLFAPGSAVYQVSDPTSSDGVRAIAARSVQDGREAWSLLLVNDHDEAAVATVAIPAGGAWRQYRYQEPVTPSADEQALSAPLIAATNGPVRLALAAHSAIFLTNGPNNLAWPN